MKIFIASFNRASDGALEHLIKKLKERNMLETDYMKADYILAPGDRTETYDFVLTQFRRNKPIIHLWAGEISCFELHDDVYRHSMTLMSMMQLCTNDRALLRVMELCRAVDKVPNVHVVGNVMLDDLSTDESIVPKEPYVLILYNPVTVANEEEVKEEIKQVKEQIKRFGVKHIWIEPNGDMFSELVKPCVTHKSLPRSQFLGLMKNCKAFITNSSCQYYEAPFFLKKQQIIPVGKRNIERESKYANMSIKGATDKIIEILEGLK